MVGPRGSHKSRVLAAMLGASVKEEGDWYGAKAIRRGPVYAVIAEDVSGWKERWFAWRQAEGIADKKNLPLQTWRESVNLFTGVGFEDLLADVQRTKPIVIGLDPLSDLMTGADENSQNDMGIVRDRLKHLASNGRSVVAVHHTGHDESRERGSSVLGSMADTIILMRADDDDILMTCTKQRNGPPFASLRLQFDATRLVLRQAGVGFGKLPKQQTIVLEALKVLAATSPNGVEIKALKTRCVNEEGVKLRTFFDAKRKLVDAGRVVESSIGKFRPALDE